MRILWTFGLAMFLFACDQAAEPAVEEVVDTTTDAELVDMSKAYQTAYINNDYDGCTVYMTDAFSTTVFNSNGSPLVDQTEEQITLERAWAFDEFVMANHRLERSGDGGTVVITFDTEGSLSFEDGPQNIPYSTRASQVWVNTADGWKIMHSHWSPKAEAQGIPGEE